MVATKWFQLQRRKTFHGKKPLCDHQMVLITKKKIFSSIFLKMKIGGHIGGFFLMNFSSQPK